MVPFPFFTLRRFLPEIDGQKALVALQHDDFGAIRMYLLRPTYLRRYVIVRQRCPSHI